MDAFQRHDRAVVGDAGRVVGPGRGSPSRLTRSWPEPSVLAIQTLLLLMNTTEAPWAEGASASPTSRKMTAPNPSLRM